jgi:hypothetical protein
MTISKSYRPNSRPPFGVFSESANSNNPISLQVPERCFNRHIRFWGVEQTDMGLKYNKDFAQAMEILKSLD